MFYTIYKITNTVNGKYYIGKHQTKDLNDGYMGSGKHLKRAIKKHGIDNFSKEILHVFQTEQEMNDKEKELVLLEENCYNLCPGGHGGFGYINSNGINNKNHEHVPQMLSELHKGSKKPWSSEIMKQRHKEGKVVYSTTKGIPRSDLAKEKQRIAMTGRVPWNKGIPRSEETKKKISNSIKSRISFL